MTTRLPRAAALLVGAAAVALSLMTPAPTEAHGDPTIEVTLTQVQPRLPDGLSLEVFTGEQVEVALFNRTSSPATVLDPAGRPFLKVSDNGVSGDIRSDTLRVTAGQVEGSNRAATSLPGSWRRLSSRGGWIWADTRLDPTLLVVPQGQSGSDRGLGALSGQPGTLGRWKISITYRGTTYIATGEILRRSGLGEVTENVTTAPYGVDASVIAGTPPMVRLVPDHGVRVQVLGADGRPFLRSTPAGVMARSDSPDYQANLRALELPVPAGRRWVSAFTGDKLEWVDERLAYAGSPSPSVTAPVVVKRWAIPVLVDGRRQEVAGTDVWTPLAGPSIAYGPRRHHALDGPLGYGAAGALALLLLAVAAWSRRKEQHHD